jgi:hypothetical protein
MLTQFICRVRPSLPVHARFPATGHFSRPLPWGYLVDILVFSAAPACPFEAFRSVAESVHLLPPSLGATILGWSSHTQLQLPDRLVSHALVGVIGSC